MGDQIFASLLTIDLSNIDAQVTFRARIPMACFSLSFFIALDNFVRGFTLAREILEPLNEVA